jgi:Fic family protein
MRRKAKYIHQLSGWPAFEWDHEKMVQPISKVRHHQGKLLGRMEALGFQLREDASLQTLTIEIVKSSEIEGEILATDQVRSSLARKLGLDVAGLVPSGRHVDGIVELMLDATLHFDQPLTEERLFSWHSLLFPTGRSGMYKITVGNWRIDEQGPMQVVSGAMGRERIHYQAPDANKVADEMITFLNWFNGNQNIDPVLKAALAHFWFVTIHPFDDGNGRIARAISDMQLARSDGSTQRFYSMSAQIRKESTAYYDCLEKTQGATLDITEWIMWFIENLDRSIKETEESLTELLSKIKFWEKHNAKVLNERQRMILNKLLDNFEGKLTTSKWSKMAKCSPDTALRDIQFLIDQEILEKEPGGGRSTSYRIKEMYNYR